MIKSNLHFFKIKFDKINGSFWFLRKLIWEFRFSFCNLLGKSLVGVGQVFLSVIAAMTQTPGMSYPVNMFALGGKVTTSFRVIAIVAHPLGVVLLVGVLTLRDCSTRSNSLLFLFLVLGSISLLLLGIRFLLKTFFHHKYFFAFCKKHLRLFW